MLCFLPRASCIADGEIALIGFVVERNYQNRECSLLKAETSHLIRSKTRERRCRGTENLLKWFKHLFLRRKLRFHMRFGKRGSVFSFII